MRRSTLMILATPLLLGASAVVCGAESQVRTTHAKTVATANVATASPTAGTRSPSFSRLTEQDARSWLADYRTAWDTRDLTGLSALGAIRAEQQETLRRALARYRRLDVYISNEEIALDEGRLWVSFDRVDVDETGKALKHPRQSVLLERTASGVVSTWRGYVTQ